MKSLAVFVIGAITGGLIELVLAVLFEEWARQVYGRARRHWWWLRSRFGAEQHHHARELFHVGSWTVSCVVVEGDAAHPMNPSQVSCRLDSTALILPPDLEERRTRILEQQKKIEKAKGLPEYFNGPMVALTRFERSRTPGREDSLLHLVCQLTDYYTFLATSISLDEVIDGEAGSTVRQKYLRSTNYDEPVSFLATSLGVNLALITKDGYLMLVRRGLAGVHTYRDNWAVPICEAVNPDLDRDETGHVSLLRTAVRGAHEELSVVLTNPQVSFFVLCVDTKCYFYAMTGLVNDHQSTSEFLMSLRTRGIKDKFEAGTLERVRFDPEAVARFVAETGGVSNWHPNSFAAVVQALVNAFGNSAVERAFGKPH